MFSLRTYKLAKYKPLHIPTIQNIKFICGAIGILTGVFVVD